MDTLTEAGAHRLAIQIAHYWRQRGYEISTWVEPAPFRGDKVMFCVRSDMVCGHPQRKARKAA